MGLIHGIFNFIEDIGPIFRSIRSVGHLLDWYNNR